MSSVIICPYCESLAKLVDSIEVYKVRSYGPIWVCSKYPECDSYVGCHPGTEKALGDLADSDLRKCRALAHKHFDLLWNEKIRRTGCKKKNARRAAYKWLTKSLGIDANRCHIGKMDTEMCRQVVEACLPYVKKIKENLNERKQRID